MNPPQLYFNANAIDTDSFSDTFDQSQYLDFYNTLFSISFVVGIINDFVIGLAAVTAQVIFILLYCRHSEFRTRTNLFILFSSTLGILQYLKIIHSRLSTLFHYFTIEIICIEIEFDHLAQIFYFIFAICLAVECILFAGENLYTSLYKLAFKYLLCCIHLLFLTLIIVKWSACILNPLDWLYARLHQFKAIVYSVVIVLMGILNFIGQKLIHETVNKHGLLLSNIMVFSYLPVYVHHVLIFYCNLHYFLKQFLMLTQFLPELIAQSHPMLVVYLCCKRRDLQHCSRWFVYFSKILKRDNELDDRHAEVEIIERNGHDVERGEINHTDDESKLLV